MIGEGSQDHESVDRNTDSKILPIVQTYIYIACLFINMHRKKHKLFIKSSNIENTRGRVNEKNPLLERKNSYANATRSAQTDVIHSLVLISYMFISK